MSKQTSEMQNKLTVAQKEIEAKNMKLIVSESKLQLLKQQKQSQNKQDLERQRSQMQKYFQAQKKALQESLKQVRQQLDQTNNPENIKMITQKMKNLYWNELSRQQFPLMPCCAIILIGRTNAGKSSLLNALFKLKLKTSIASCTKEICPVAAFQNRTIFDCPGFDTHFDLVKHPEAVPRYLGSMHVICYLYNGIVEEDIVRTLVAMKKRIIGVRTHCDPQNDEGEYDQIRASDIDQFTKYGASNTPVFFTTKKGGLDNNKLLEHLLSLQV